MTALAAVCLRFREGQGRIGEKPVCVVGSMPVAVLHGLLGSPAAEQLFNFAELTCFEVRGPRERRTDML